MDELMVQFAIEARELVQQSSKDLLSLEANPGDRESLESAFRAIHTLKGSVALFDFGLMQDVLHRAEDLLSQARSGRIDVSAALIDPLMEVIEWVEVSIDGISRTGHLLEAQDKQAARLLGLLDIELTEGTAEPAAVSAAQVPEWALALQQAMVPSDVDETLIAIRYEPHSECFFNGDDPLAIISQLADVRHLTLSLNGPAPSPEDYDPFRCILVIEAVSGASLKDVQAAFRLIPDQVELIPLPKPLTERMAPAWQAAAAPSSARQRTTLRVDSARIDKLIEIAGELVTAKNGLAPLAFEARSLGNAALSRRILSSHHEIEQLVASLYTAVTRARLIPLEQTFRRFSRLVRETAPKLGKAVDLIIEGETVEADREIVEDLFEPLLHLIRNSLDHGIEPEADRIRLSKPPRGRIQLRARQSGDHVEIEIKDDGRGIDPDRVGRTAVDRGLISTSRASGLSHKEMLQLVFAPGFSTAATVSDLSGRGVGLDVVNRSIQRLGGTIELQSTPGSGTTFTLRLPVSVSMAQLMVVEAGGERYGIPISDVVETHKLPAGAVQPVRAGKAYILRDRTIPLLYLAELLQLPEARLPADDIKVLIVRVGEELIGVAVDAIAERAETLTRPLDGLLQGVSGILGTTLLGDGKVLLVLNLEELVQ